MIVRNHLKRSKFVVGLAVLALSLHYPGLALAKTSSTESSAHVVKVDATTPVKSGPSEFTIKAAVPTHPRAILKNGNNFLMMEESGLMPAGTDFGYGLYRDDTRYLTQWDMSINGVPLSPLSSVTNDGFNGRFLYANQSYIPEPEKKIAEQTLLVQRDIVITDEVYERLSITNFGSGPASGDLGIKYGADFADMFEVRGMPRKARSHDLTTHVMDNKRQADIAYKGLDGQVMKTRITFMREKPSSMSDTEARFHFKVGPKNVFVIETVIGTNLNEPEVDPTTDDKVSEPLKKYTYEKQKAIADQGYAKWRSEGTTITTDNEVFNRLLERGYRDLYILRQSTPRGECVAAGVPWFAVAFGRDQDIVGRETVALMPDLTRSILHVLAEYQGTRDDAVTEEKPGKIMHELRVGEMARCKEIPFRPYFGTIDATPLWIVLMGDYVDWTGDKDFAKQHWSNVLKALDCLDEESKSGYLTYGSKANAALSNQGWKDSFDSITTANGQLAPPPIALAEVQGYLYAAWQSGAKLAKINGDDALAEKLLKKAEDLKVRFNNDFHSKQHAYMYIALGNNAPCDVVSSNPGQCLSTGILTKDYAEEVSQVLMRPEMFCGWGVRTLSAFERAYNPISYHDGSVWPHDNAMIVEGLCKVGHGTEGMRIMNGMFGAAQGKTNLRLPELFCGFSKNFSGVPIWYPVSCEPQAWAAGSMFLMLKSGLGLQADAVNNKLHVVNPTLPPFLSSVKIQNLRVGTGKVSLEFSRAQDKTECTVAGKSDGLGVSIEK
jgi:glycogen debranching enzyme